MTAGAAAEAEAVPVAFWSTARCRARSPSRRHRPRSDGSRRGCSALSTGPGRAIRCCNGETDLYDLVMHRIGLIGTLVLGFVLAAGCTRRNPSVCCTTAADCLAQGLPTSPCARPGRPVFRTPVRCRRPMRPRPTPCRVRMPPCPSCPDAQACFGSGNFMVCLFGSQLPTHAVTLPNAINTDDISGTSPCLATAPMTWSGQPDACFVVGTTIASPSGGGRQDHRYGLATARAARDRQHDAEHGRCVEPRRVGRRRRLLGVRRVRVAPSPEQLQRRRRGWRGR